MSQSPTSLPRLLAWILLLWAVANFLPYLTVYLLTGQPYYQALPQHLVVLVEVWLLSMNLGLPLWWLHRRGIPWPQGLAWRWEAARSWRWRLVALAVILVWGWLVTRLIPLPNAIAPQGQPITLQQLPVFMLELLALWAAAIAGEESMFRGWMQTQLEAYASAWFSVLLPALLFGLRHLPLDLYSGHAGVAGWSARLLELYGLALVLGLVGWRVGSIAPTVITHGILWPLAIFGSEGTLFGAVLGAVIA